MSRVLSFVTLFRPKGAYLLVYSWLFGMSVWISFFGGVIAFKTLPRQQFGALQHKTFPIYFVISIVLSSILLGIWSTRHSGVLTHDYANPLIGEVAQAYALSSVILAQASNYFVIGPMTSGTMFRRYQLEKQEKEAGKTSDEPSPEMKALNRRFGMLHGISSLANLWAVIALAFHGLWIGSVGI